jgi:hypothetical protein
LNSAAISTGHRWLLQVIADMMMKMDLDGVVMMMPENLFAFDDARKLVGL